MAGGVGVGFGTGRWGLYLTPPPKKKEVFRPVFLRTTGSAAEDRSGMTTTPTKPILQEQPLEGEPELTPAPNDADGMWMAEGQVLMESGGGPDSRGVLHPVCVRPRHYDSECFMYINEKKAGILPGYRESGRVL